MATQALRSTQLQLLHSQKFAKLKMSTTRCLNDFFVTTHTLGEHDMPCVAVKSTHNFVSYFNLS